MQYVLLVFEIDFLQPCYITGVIYEGVGRWEGVVGVGGQWKAGSPCHYGTDNSPVFSVGDRDVHNPQDRLRQTLAAVWHPTNSDWCSPVIPQVL